MPYWVGVKKGWAVTWQTKTKRHRGVDGKLPAPPAWSLVSLQALNRAVAARPALARPAPVSSRRRAALFRSRVSTASSTVGWIRRINAPEGGSVSGAELVDGGALI